MFKFEAKTVSRILKERDLIAEKYGEDVAKDYINSIDVSFCEEFNLNENRDCGTALLNLFCWDSNSRDFYLWEEINDYLSGIE